LQFIVQDRIFFNVIFCNFSRFSGVFVLLQAVAALKYLQNFLTKSEFKVFFFVSATLAAGVVFLTVVGLTWLGVIAPWSGR
jgi:dolichyl-diphosphooligosaccharide--protein glycosyltransferase